MFPLLLALAVLADPVEHSFPFAMPGLDHAPTAVDVGFLNPEPAGARGPVVIRDGHFYDPAGNRLRFFGTNITFSAAFPPKEVATAVAARLRKLGFNLIRFHHIDNSPAPRGLWQDDTQTALDPAQLERLDWFIAELRRHGLYINLNLHVSRNYAGLPKDLSRTFRYGKVIDHFHPRLIEQQKQYATMLLSHRNPYTKLTYAEDPAVVMVELNNENALTTQTFNPELLTLPGDLSRPLLEGWPKWLERKYGTVDKLQAAWRAGADAPGPFVLTQDDLSGQAAQWLLEVSAPGQATMKVEPSGGPDGAPALVATMTQPGSRSWDFQVHRRNLDLTEDKVYTLTFWARSDAAREIRAGVRLQEPDYRFQGLNTAVRLTPTWQRFQYLFTATGLVPRKTRLSFSLANLPGTVALARVSLREGAEGSLPEGATFADIAPPLTEGLLPPRADWAAYLSDLEQAYVAELRRHIRETLGSKAAFINSQVSYGGAAGILRENNLADYGDMHSYWQHPSFPRRPWDGNDWTIGNTPMVAATGGTFPKLAAYRLAGKPYVVSEYDHAAPSLYAAEMYPLFASFASFQDWDGILQFTLASSVEHYTADKLTGYFNLATHPGKLAFAPLAALIFRQGLVPPAPGETILEIPRERVPALVAAGAGDSLWSAAGAAPTLFLQRRTAVRVVDGDGPPRLVGDPGAPAAAGCLTLEASPLQWHSEPKEQAAFTMAVPQAAAVVGRIGGRTVSAGPLEVTLAPTTRNFASLLLVSADGRPLAESKRLLLAVAGAVVNREMNWNETLTTVGNRWGSGPTQAEALTATLRLRTGNLRVRALDPTGAPEAEVPAVMREGALEFKIEPAHETLWYELSAS